MWGSILFFVGWVLCNVSGNHVPIGVVVRRGSGWEVSEPFFGGTFAVESANRVRLLVQSVSISCLILDDRLFQIGYLSVVPGKVLAQVMW